MLAFWSSFITGFVLVAVPHWCGLAKFVDDHGRLDFRRLVRRPDGRVSLLAIALILIGVFAAFCVGFSLLRVAANFGTEPAIAVLEVYAWRATPVLGGVLLGILSAGWLIGALGQSGAVHWTGLAIAGGALFVVIILLDRQHGWFKNLNRLQAGAVTIELSVKAEREGIRAPNFESAFSLASSTFSNQPGWADVSLALSILESTVAAPERDGAYAWLAGATPTRSELTPKAREWLQGATKQLRLINSVHHDRTLDWLIGPDLVDRLRLYWHRQRSLEVPYSYSGSPLDPGLRDDVKALSGLINAFAQRLSDARDAICQYPANLSEEDRKTCANRRRLPQCGEGNRSGGTHAPCFDLRPNPYWALIVAASLYGSNQVESAVRILDGMKKWFEDEAKKNNGHLNPYVLAQKYRLYHWLGHINSIISEDFSNRKIALHYFDTALYTATELIKIIDPDGSMRSMFDENLETSITFIM